jgi:hypothetical protein
MLDVAHVVEQQLEKADLARSEPARLGRALGCEPAEHGAALLTPVGEVAQQLVFGIHAVGQDAGRVELVERERLGRLEAVERS